MRSIWVMSIPTGWGFDGGLCGVDASGAKAWGGGMLEATEAIRTTKEPWWETLNSMSRFSSSPFFTLPFLSSAFLSASCSTVPGGLRQYGFPPFSIPIPRPASSQLTPNPLTTATRFKKVLPSASAASCGKWKRRIFFFSAGERRARAWAGDGVSAQDEVLWEAFDGEVE